MIDLLAGVTEDTTGDTYHVQDSQMGNRSVVVQVTFTSGDGDVTIQGRVNDNHAWVPVKVFSEISDPLADEVSVFPQMRAVLANSGGGPEVWVSASARGHLAT